MEHSIKCLPEHYDAIERGVKTLELRLNDRNYQIGDTLLLRRFDPGRYYQALMTVTPIVTAGDYAREIARVTAAAYTGQSLRVRVTHILSGGPWLSPGYVAMSIKPAEYPEHPWVEKRWAAKKKSRE